MQHPDSTQYLTTLLMTASYLNSLTQQQKRWHTKLLFAWNVVATIASKWVVSVLSSFGSALIEQDFGSIILCLIGQFILLEVWNINHCRSAGQKPVTERPAKVKVPDDS